MDALTRHRLLLLQGVELRDGFEVRALDEDDEIEEVLDGDPTVEDDEEEHEDDEEDVESPALRHRLLALAGVPVLPPEVLGEEVRALLAALEMFEERGKAPLRIPKGFEGGGRFRSITDQIFKKLEDWAKGDGPDDPFEGFNRNHLRQAAKARGITLRRGASENEIKNAILADVRGKTKTGRKENAEKEASAKFTIDGKDVAVYQEKDGKVSLYEESDTGKRGRKVVSVDSLEGLEEWADSEGHDKVSEWARKERGDGAPKKRAPAKKATPKKAAAPDAESKAVQRQKVIDRKRSIAEALGEIEELLDNGASDKALESRIRSRAKVSGVPDDVRDDLLDAIGDEDRLRSILDSLSSSEGFTKVGRTGSTVTFDPKKHEAVGNISTGTRVNILRPGFTWTESDGNVVTLRRPVALAVGGSGPALEPQHKALLRRANVGPLKKGPANTPGGRQRNRDIDDLVAEGYLEPGPDDTFVLTERGRKAVGMDEPFDPRASSAPQPFTDPEAKADLRRPEVIAAPKPAKAPRAPRKPRPDYLDDENSLVLDKFAESLGIDLTPFRDPARDDMVAHGAPIEDQFPFGWSIDRIADSFVNATMTKEQAIAEMRNLAEVARRRPTFTTGKRFLSNRDRAEIDQAPGVADAMDRLAEALAGVTLPKRRRKPPIGEVIQGGPAAAIDESRFKTYRATGRNGTIRHRGEVVPESFKHETGGVGLFGQPGERPQRPGLSRAENDAVDLMIVGTVADALNGSLRRGQTDHGTLDLRTIAGGPGVLDLDQQYRDLLSAIQGGELVNDAMLFRGSLMRPTDIRKLVPGSIYTEPGFLHTATGPGIAHRIIRWRQRREGSRARKPVIFQILAPRGTSAALGHEMADEAILGPGRRMRVVRVEQPVGRDGQHTIVMELLPEG